MTSTAPRAPSVAHIWSIALLLRLSPAVILSTVKVVTSLLIEGGSGCHRLQGPVQPGRYRKRRRTHALVPPCHSRLLRFGFMEPVPKDPLRVATAIDHGDDRGISRLVADRARHESQRPVLNIAMADLVSSKQFSETAALSDRLLQSSALKAVSRTGSVFDQLYKQNRFFEQMTNPSWMEQVVNPPIQRALDRLTPQATGFQSLLPDVSAFIGPLSIDLTALAGPAVMASVPGFDFSTMFTDLVPSLSVVVDFPGLRVAVDSALGAAFQPERMAKAATAFNRDLFSNFATAVPVTALRLPGIPFGFTAYNSGLITPETSAWKWSAEIDAEAVLQGCPAHLSSWRSSCGRGIPAVHRQQCRGHRASAEPTGRPGQLPPCPNGPDEVG